MIRTSRRGLMAGALAIPAAAGFAGWRWQSGDKAVLLHDAALQAGRRFAAASRGQSVAVEGDRVRFMRAVLAAAPALVAGVTRHADQFLLADIAREHGYRPVATIDARAGRCTAASCQPGWGALGRLSSAAGADWVDVLADYATNPGGAIAAGSGRGVAAHDKGLVLGWVLVRG